MRWLAATATVIARPWLWVTGLRQALRLAPSGWWRRKPYLPLPAEDYLSFRLQTQYGGGSSGPTGHDLVAYLEWCRRYGDALR